MHEKDREQLTTATGTPVDDNQTLLTAGERVLRSPTNG